MASPAQRSLVILPWLKRLAPVVAGVVAGVVGSTVVHVVSPPSKKSLPAVPAQTPRETHRQYLQKFEREPISPPWAGRAEGAIDAWFQSVSAHGLAARLDEVRCHTQTCIATLSWNSRTGAEREYRQLLAFTSPSLSTCNTEIYLPEGSVSPYSAQLVLAGCREVN